MAAVVLTLVMFNTPGLSEASENVLNVAYSKISDVRAARAKSDSQETESVMSALKRELGRQVAVAHRLDSGLKNRDEKSTVPAKTSFHDDSTPSGALNEVMGSLGVSETNDGRKVTLSGLDRASVRLSREIAAATKQAAASRAAFNQLTAGRTSAPTPQMQGVESRISGQLKSFESVINSKKNDLRNADYLKDDCRSAGLEALTGPKGEACDQKIHELQSALDALHTESLDFTAKMQALELERQSANGATQKMRDPWAKSTMNGW